MKVLSLHQVCHVSEEESASLGVHVHLEFHYGSLDAC